MKIKYRMPTDELEFIPTPSGTTKIKKRELMFDKDSGYDIIDYTGEVVDTDALIQASAPPTIGELVQKLTGGDIDGYRERMATAAAVSTEIRADYTHANDDLLSMYQNLNSFQAKFDSLPADFKSLFGNSSYKYLQSINDGTIQSILQRYAQPTTTTTTEDNT